MYSFQSIGTPNRVDFDGSVVFEGNFSNQNNHTLTECAAFNASQDDVLGGELQVVFMIDDIDLPFGVNTTNSSSLTVTITENGRILFYNFFN